MVDAALARRLVAEQFPAWAGLPVRPVEPGGWDNRTFRLGDAMLLRFPSAGRYAAQVAKEQVWLPRLAPHLPLPIPAVLGAGEPSDAFPRPWSVHGWIEGETAAAAPVGDQAAFGAALGGFLRALQAIDATSGPPPGPHSFFRGGALATYDAQARRAIAVLDARFDADQATAVWDAALASEWSGPPAWAHGDFAAGNLLVAERRLSAVIDFGCLAAGDPACDLAVAWTLLEGAGRAAFRAALPLDPATWARGRGWALWKAMILVTGNVEGPACDIADAQRVLGEALAYDLGRV